MKKILAIDDTLDNLITIKAVLKNKFPDFEVLTALSGEEGINMAKTEHLDLIILDIIMPKMDGYEVLQRLKADDSTKYIPVVLLTAIKSDSESRVKGLEYGADAFLSKPIDINEITAYIQVVLRTKESEHIAVKKSKELEKVVDEKLEEIKFQATVLENVIDAVITTDLEFNITSWNLGAEKIYGWRKEEAIGKSFDPLLNTNYKGKSKEKLLNILSLKGYLRGEIIHQHKNGNSIPIFRTVSIIKDVQNKPIGFVTINRDITKQKKAELEIRKLSVAVQQSPASVIITNLKGEIEYVNEAFENKTGYYLADLRGENPKIFSSGKTSKKEYEKMWEAISKGNTWSGEFLNRKKNGELYWDEALVKPILNADGEIVNYIAVNIDVTEKKRFETIQNIISNISNAAKTAIELKDLIQVIQKELGKIIDTQNFFVALCNDDDETLHLPYYQDEDKYPTDFPKKGSIASEVIIGKKSLLLNYDEAYEIIKKNNIIIKGKYPKTWLGVPLKIEKKVIGALVIQSYNEALAYSEKDKEIIEIVSHQISISIELKRREEQLIEAKEKAEESDRLKSAFLANISHEIRTPMNSILGFSELLMNQELSEEKQEKYHEIVNASGKRLMNLINDIVDISKIDAHELSLNPAVFNLNKLLDQLHQQFSISPKNKNTTISTVKALKDADSFINLDETRLAQVFSNLLENALKFTHDGTIELGYTLAENKLHFYVKDSGVGINAKDHQHIFERFGQSDNEVLKVKDGSGLGLAISKGIVELFGGNIWVTSEPNKGATFHFTIPNCVVDYKENSSIGKPIENAVMTTTKTILIAEDEETNFWYLEAALDGHPFNLIHVLNGKEAVEEMQTNNSIDLILMDFNMPIMNGMDATVEIRKTHPTIPIIALTAYALMADKEKALAIGCTDYLSKPVLKDLLLETINKYITVENPH